VTLSMHESSVGVFVQFLSSLSDLLDHAAGHAKARAIDPSILLNARELKARIAIAIGFVSGLRPAQIDGTDDKEVVFRFRNGSERKFTGRSLLLTFSVPQFFFHVTTAYDILRHCGVDIVKKDFLGNPN
jgi:uncharacterized protein